MRILWDLFRTFFKIGIFTIGGGMAMLPLVYDCAVSKEKWLTEEEMTDCIAVSQSLPGAVVINAATYIGRRKKGILGSLAATLGVIVPSFVCIILFVSLLGYIGNNKYVDGFFTGALAAAAGLVIVACFRLGKNIIKHIPDIILAIAAFIAVVFFNISVVWIIVGAVILGFPLYFLYNRKSKKGAKK